MFKILPMIGTSMIQRLAMFLWNFSKAHLFAYLEKKLGLNAHHTQKLAPLKWKAWKNSSEPI